MSEAEAPEAPKKSGKLSIKMLGIIAGIMIAEGVGVYFLVSMTAGSKSSATMLEGEAEAEREQTKEILLIEDRFPNVTSGSIWLWDTSIFLKVRNKNVDKVKEIMERREAEIKEGVSQIFRRAQDAHLRNDPGLETLTRQLTAYINEVFGTDRDDLAIIERVIIPKCTGINANG
jgi:flagellar basal body-associated protein FliL